MVPTETLSASQPWSKSSPKGDDDCVRRACLPSKLSSVWYAKSAAAAAVSAHAGTSPSSSGQSQASTAWELPTSTRPRSVMTLGASQSGRRSTSALFMGVSTCLKTSDLSVPWYWYVRSFSEPSCDTYLPKYMDLPSPTLRWRTRCLSARTSDALGNMESTGTGEQARKHTLLSKK
uniref:Uncharacterized protein n=1 Tax=Hyaloperonospora arabidopsidis (strain Emoy2) TaxID=559515 RepID=M4BAA5_HYAAE